LTQEVFVKILLIIVINKMDILQKTYAPSLSRSSADTLFNLYTDEDTLNYVLIGLILILCLLVGRYYMRQTKKDETKKDETKKDETKKDETKKDETKKDETKKDETKKDEIFPISTTL
jgi:pentapeptide MXKDX repeat protein